LKGAWGKEREMGHSRELIEFIEENYARMDSIQLTAEVNRRFNTIMTWGAIKQLHYWGPGSEREKGEAKNE
jgi:hypothetical protein